MRILVLGALLFGATAASADSWEWVEDGWSAKAEVVDDAPFEMRLTKQNENLIAQGTITRTGDTFQITRTDPDNNRCTYDGQFEADGTQFRGSYRCTRNEQTYAFSGSVVAVVGSSCQVTWRIDPRNTEVTFEGIGPTRAVAIERAREECKASQGGGIYCDAPPDPQNIRCAPSEL